MKTWEIIVVTVFGALYLVVKFGLPIAFVAVPIAQILLLSKYDFTRLLRLLIAICVGIGILTTFMVIQTVRESTPNVQSPWIMYILLLLVLSLNSCAYFLKKRFNKAHQPNKI
jgi:CDP-diglyceride synthetase